MRNTVGFDWNPVNKQLYFSDNGRDWLSEDVPQDELNRVTKVGQHFGAPYCYQGNLLDPEFGWGHNCREFDGADHADRSALGGSWACASTPARCSRRNTRTPSSLPVTARGTGRTKFGGDVIAIFLNKDGTVKSSEPFITGFLDNNSYIGRPVDVEFMADGSMLLSDDWNGAIYRITYGKAKVAGR